MRVPFCGTGDGVPISVKVAIGAAVMSLRLSRSPASMLPMEDNLASFALRASAMSANSSSHCVVFQVLKSYWNSGWNFSNIFQLGTIGHQTIPNIWVREASPTYSCNTVEAPRILCSVSYITPWLCIFCQECSGIAFSGQRRVDACSGGTSSFMRTPCVAATRESSEWSVSANLRRGGCHSLPLPSTL